MEEAIHPNFTKKDDDLYYLKSEVDKKIKEFETKEDICYKRWLKLNTENAHLKEKIKEIFKEIEKEWKNFDKPFMVRTKEDRFMKILEKLKQKFIKEDK